MAYLEILYQENDHSAVFTYLKKAFGADTGSVQVSELAPKELVRLDWEGHTDPIQLAEKMTTEIPTVVIDTESNNDLNPTSRFFNGAQLW